jgi:hypothetical protein
MATKRWQSTAMMKRSFIVLALVGLIAPMTGSAPGGSGRVSRNCS